MISSANLNGENDVETWKKNSIQSLDFNGSGIPVASPRHFVEIAISSALPKLFIFRAEGSTNHFVRRHGRQAFSNRWSLVQLV